MSRLGKLRAFKRAANSHHGRGTIAIGQQIVEMPRLSTGSLQLDVGLGGGVPVGRVTMLHGKKSSGKTTTAYRVAALSQDLCANCLRPAKIEDVVESVDADTGEVEYEAKAQCDCVSTGLYVPRQMEGEKKAEFEERCRWLHENSYEEYRIAILDVESSFDHVWASKLGLDDRRVLIAKPDTAEEAIDLYDTLARTGAVDLIILDSVAALTPSAEVEASAEKWQQGLQARLVNKLCRKAGAAANFVAREHGRQLTQLWINQHRQKIGVMFGDPTTLPGGMGQEFLTSVEVKMWSSGWDKESVDEGLAKAEAMQLGERVRVNFDVVKNKTAPARATGSYVLNVRSAQVEDLAIMMSLAERYGILVKEGTKWKYGTDSFTSKKAVKELISNDRDEFARLYGRLKSRMIGAR